MAVNKLISDVVVTEATDFITYADVKAEGRITSTSENSLITAKIKAARRMIEEFLGVDCVTKTRKATYSEVCRTITMPHAPVISIQSIYNITGSMLQTKTLLASCDYNLVGNVIYNQMPFGKEINYTTGYTSTTIPEVLKQAIIKQTLILFDNRDVDMGIDSNVVLMIKEFRRNLI